MARIYRRTDDSQAKKEQELSLNFWDPIMERFHSFIDAKTPSQRITFSVLILGLVAAVSVIDKLMHLPRFIEVILALPLAVGTLAVIMGFVHRQVVKNGNAPTLRDRFSPIQRLRLGFVAYAVLLVFLFGTNGTIPTALGAIIAFSVGLSIYHFIRRSKEEIALAEAGIVDPRDEKAVEEEEIVEDVDEDKVAEYAEFINSLPEEQRRLILDPKLNGAITVAEDDSKKKKKKKLFRR